MNEFEEFKAGQTVCLICSPDILMTVRGRNSADHTIVVNWLDVNTHPQEARYFYKQLRIL